MGAIVLYEADKNRKSREGITEGKSKGSSSSKNQKLIAQHDPCNDTSTKIHKK